MLQGGYDQDRDKEIKLRLQEIMNKYNIKQVEVAKETGKNLRTLTEQASTTRRFRCGFRARSRAIW